MTSNDLQSQAKYFKLNELCIKLLIDYYFIIKH